MLWINILPTFLTTTIFFLAGLQWKTPRDMQFPYQTKEPAAATNKMPSPSPSHHINFYFSSV